jgi:signal transduction histidine kinase
VEVQTGARQLTLDRALDERIDSVPLSLEPGRPAEPEGLWVIGSELRLHQVLTNLATNAVKYTPEGGGSIRISTEFLGITMRDELPGNPPDIEQEQPHERSMEKTDHTGTRVGEASELHQSAHRSHSPLLTRNGSGSVQQTQCLSFRLEVHDSGPGIKPSDLVEDRLFQPFVQVMSSVNTLFRRVLDTLFADHGRAVERIR